jgi:hypothetical protein
MGKEITRTFETRFAIDSSEDSTLHDCVDLFAHVKHRLFDRLTRSEKIFLRVMAQLGPGTHRTSDIAEVLGIKIASLGPVRAKLMRKGMVYSPSHGDMMFTVPLFDEFMIRAIPEFKR